MAQAVVDRLEVVQVEEEDGETLSIGDALEPCHGVLQAIPQQRPVRESGERVLKGLAPELLLHGPLLGHIAVGHRDAPDRRVVGQVLAERDDPPPTAVRVAHPDLGVHLRAGRADELLQVCPGQGGVIGVDEGRDIGPQAFLHRIAQDALDRRALVDDDPGWVENRIDVARMLDESPEAALGASLRASNEPEQTDDHAAGHDDGEHRVEGLSACGFLRVGVVGPLSSREGSLQEVMDRRDRPLLEPRRLGDGSRREHDELLVDVSDVGVEGDHDPRQAGLGRAFGAKPDERLLGGRPALAEPGHHLGVGATLGESVPFRSGESFDEHLDLVELQLAASGNALGVVQVHDDAGRQERDDARHGHRNTRTEPPPGGRAPERSAY